MGFEVHQPYRLNPAFEPGRVKRGRKPEEAYFSDSNREILQRVCEKCYLPATQLMLELLDEGFKCAYSLSGTLVEQLERWNPDALDLFRQVARHRNAEMLSQTYYHSIASLFDDGLAEFQEQVQLHRRLMKDVFGVETQVLENTEFIFNNAIAASAARMGFKAAYTEGVDRILGWRSPNYVYSCRGMKVLMRNFPLSDDVAFRFPNRGWPEWPLTADKYASWIAASPGDFVNVFVDYETFGEHQWVDTGIMEFLRWLPRECTDRDVTFATPSEIAELEPKEELRFDETVSWADVEKDVSAWLGNTIQHTALRRGTARQGLRAGSRNLALPADERSLLLHGVEVRLLRRGAQLLQPGRLHEHRGLRRLHAGARRLRGPLRTEDEAERRGRRAGCLPPEKAFRFRNPVVYTGFTAYSLDDFGEMLNYVPSDSVAYHIERGDFARWVRDVLQDEQPGRPR